MFLMGTLPEVGQAMQRTWALDPKTPRFKSLPCLLCVTLGRLSNLCAWFITVPASQAACEDSVR